MYLYIDTASSEYINLALMDEKGNFLARKKIIAKYQQSEKLLVNIDKLVGKKLKKVKGVIVVKGPGSFTALRIGVTTANTLAFALRLPIIGIRLDDKIDVSIKKIIKIKKFRPVVPEYGAQPNISKPKK
jgi:tRNA threonylcarbamoyladenosine biosynthesis protein TsaB